MVQISVPLGRGSVTFELPKRNLLGVVNPRAAHGVTEPAKEIERALSNPIGERLSELANPGERVAIVVTDHTRPCPDRLILPFLLRELKTAGVRLEDITVVIGTGMHRPMKQDEIQKKFGKLGVEVVNHDPRDSHQLVYLGEMKSGGKIYINRRVAEADLVVGVGVVEPHQYAGFSGGRKLVAVGVAGERTIAHTHQPRFIDAKGTRLGKLKGNPFHLELIEIASRTNLRFAVNVVLNAGQELVRCFAGDPKASLEAAAELARKLYIRPVRSHADILVLGVGHPKDIDLYQASRGITYAYFASKPAINEGGIIILAALCSEGTGDPRFETIFRRSRSPSEVVARSMDRTFEPGEQRAYMLARVLEHARVVLVGSSISPRLLREMFIKSARTMDGALKAAFKELGTDAKVLVIPHSLLTIPNLKG